MNNRFGKVLALIACLSMTACLPAQPKPSDIQSADYGKKPEPGVMESAVKRYMSGKLIDPASAQYECTNTRKTWLVAVGGGEGNVNHGQTYYGWYAVCMINAKNRFGGYTGAKRYHFMIYQNNGTQYLGHFDGFESGAPVPE